MFCVSELKQTLDHSEINNLLSDIKEELSSYPDQIIEEQKSYKEENSKCEMVFSSKIAASKQEQELEIR